MSTQPLVSSTSAVTIDGVYQAYGQHVVLRNVSLTVNPHEVVAIIGPSGCGKSTLLRTVNLIEPIISGRISLGDDVITQSGVSVNRVRQRIGMVFQQFNLFPHLTVLQNIVLAPRRVGRVARTEAERRALELLTRFGLADKAGEYPDRLSGGQQQRVAIIRALATSPEVLLLDEVTSALDPETVGEVLELIRELGSLGQTLVIVTHDLTFARHVADRIVFMDAGEIVEVADPDRLLDSPSDERTRRFVQRVLHPESAARKDAHDD